MNGRPVAIVTGGARRVGRAICIALARAGCDIHLTYFSSKEIASGLVEELGSMGASARAHRLDLNDTHAVGNYGDTLVRAGERVDILVHNASVYDPTPIGQISAREYERAQRVNALSPLLLTQTLADSLRASEMAGGGAVVALCDIHAMGIPRARYSAYSMSKAALGEMVRTLAVELAPDVRVNGVAPGVVAWPEQGHESDEASQERYLQRVPMGRAGTSEDAAEAVRWLALDAHYTTGQIIRVDGGRSLR